MKKTNLYILKPFLLLMCLLVSVNTFAEKTKSKAEDEAKSGLKSILFKVSEVNQETMSMEVVSSSKTDNTLPTQLKNVYESVKSDSPDFSLSSGSSVSMSKMVRNRCIAIYAALLLILIGKKVLPVMYSPDKELDPKFWIKPVLLALFLSCYHPMMNFVDKVMDYISFSDFTSSNIRVVKKTTAEMSAKWWVNPLANLVKPNPTVSVDTTDFNMMDLIRGTVDLETEMHEMDTMQILMNSIGSGELPDDKCMKKIEKWWASWNISEFIPNLLNSLLVWLAEIIVVVIRVLQCCLLCVLYIGGPIAVCCELLFKGSLHEWFLKYVKVHLMTPVIFIIDCTNFMLQQAMGADDFRAAFGTVIVSIVMFVMYTRIEQVAGYFMEGGDVGATDMAKAAVTTAAVAGAGTAVAGGAVVGVAGVGIASSAVATAAMAGAKAKMAEAGIKAASKMADVGQKISNAKGRVLHNLSDATRRQTTFKKDASNVPGKKGGEVPKNVTVNNADRGWLSNKLEKSAQKSDSRAEKMGNIVKNKDQMIKESTDRIKNFTTQQSVKMNSMSMLKNAAKTTINLIDKSESNITTGNIGGIGMTTLQGEFGGNTQKQDMAKVAKILDQTGDLPQEVADKLIGFGVLPPDFQARHKKDGEQPLPFTPDSHRDTLTRAQRGTMEDIIKLCQVQAPKTSGIGDIPQREPIPFNLKPVFDMPNSAGGGEGSADKGPIVTPQPKEGGSAESEAGRSGIGADSGNSNQEDQRIEKGDFGKVNEEKPEFGKVVEDKKDFGKAKDEKKK